MEETDGIAEYLTTVKTGERVFLLSFSGQLTKVRISKTTTTQVVLDNGERCKKATGEAMGGSTWGRNRIVVPTTEVQAKWKKQFLARWSAQNLPAIFKTLTPEQQVAIFRLVKSFDKENKGEATQPADGDTDGLNGLDE
ncbi:hypothetical protein [Pseudomonas sp.]|uniref:hypothetical protein n=1 Tax=Pseudomonas sp. TaxID=306 RepID=UPI00291500D4|nr:hypothetical protein [Pseudomonas sp.]MDU4254512.1 hypothetical protein [Pseudomonas sp.]